MLPAGTVAAFEFRHPSWYHQATYDLLASRDCALCTSDKDGEDLAPVVPTASWGYLRLRRADYGEDALAGWASQVRDQAWDRAYVFFKHEDEGAAPRMAERFVELASV